MDLIWQVFSRAEYAAAPFPLNLILEENALPGIKEKVCWDGYSYDQ